MCKIVPIKKKERKTRMSIKKKKVKEDRKEMEGKGTPTRPTKKKEIKEGAAQYDEYCS